MIKHFASAAALAIFVSAAAAQNPPPPPPPADQASPGDEGPAGRPPPPPADRANPGDEGPRGRPRPPGPPPGAHVRVDLGKDRRIDVGCSDREPFKACIDGAMAIMDRAMPAMRADAPPPPPPPQRGWDRERMPMQEEHMGMVAPPAMREYMRSMHDMMREMGESEFTGDPSHDFAAIMVPYNKSAVAMAESLLKNENTDPQVRMMARKMIQEQADNAAQLEDWLKTQQR
jgi:hypothetical protein